MISANKSFNELYSEQGKLAKIAKCMVGTSVAHERIFSVVNRVTELRSSLMTQLEAVVRASEQSV